MRARLQHLDHFLESLQENIGVVVLEDKHGPQPNSTLSASTNVDTNTLSLSQDLVPLRRVPSDEGTLALTTQVLEVLGVLLRQTLETSVQVSTGSSGVLNQTQTLDLLDDAAEDQCTGRVTHPGVELAVGLVGAQGGVAVVVTGRLGLLGEGDHVRRGVEVPVVVGPELSCGSDTGLDFVDNEEDIGALGDVAQSLEESGRSVVVTTLGLDGLDHDGGHGVVVLLDKALNLLQAALLLLSVLLSMLLKRVLQRREGSLGPIEGGDIQLVNSFATGRRQTAKETAVESRLERQDGQLRGSWLLILHGGLQLLLAEVGLGSSTLQLATVHEGCLVGDFVGVGASHGSVHLAEALGSNLEDTRLEDVGPFSGREVTQSRSVDQRRNHLGRCGHLLEVGVVVSDGDRGNLSVAAYC